MIVLRGIHAGDPRPDSFHPLNKLAAQPAIDVLVGQRSEKPGGAKKQVRVGKFHSGLFFPRHRVPGEEAPACIPSQDRGRARHHVALGAAHIGKQSARRKHRADAFNKINNAPRGSRE